MDGIHHPCLGINLKNQLSGDFPGSPVAYIYIYIYINIFKLEKKAVVRTRKISGLNSKGTMSRRPKSYLLKVSMMLAVMLFDSKCL